LQLRENAQYSLRQLAQAAGVSNPYLSQIERGLRKPSAEILQQLAKALEISAETLYVRAGLLDGAEGAYGDDSPSAASSAGGSAQVNRVIAAIGDDPALTRRQKQILREIYESFRTEPAGQPSPGESEPSTDTGLDAPPETRGD
jgi:transcriptional regulator with XRE-family HTH domain